MYCLHTRVCHHTHQINGDGPLDGQDGSGGTILSVNVNLTGDGHGHGDSMCKWALNVRISLICAIA